MRRKKAEFARVYENGSEYTKYVIGYKVINIPRFKHKKKPISMIKALNVRDSINYRKKLWTIQERSKEHFPENTMLLSEAGGGDMGKLTSTNLETGEKVEY